MGGGIDTRAFDFDPKIVVAAPRHHQRWRRTKNTTDSPSHLICVRAMPWWVSDVHSLCEWAQIGAGPDGPETSAKQPSHTWPPPTADHTHSRTHTRQPTRDSKHGWQECLLRLCCLLVTPLPLLAGIGASDPASTATEAHAGRAALGCRCRRIGLAPGRGAAGSSKPWSLWTARG